MNLNDICKKYNITNYTINNGLVDVDGDVYLYNKRLTKLPLNFGNVSGDFYCDDNNLTTLSGSPKSVGGHFSCTHNKLTDLKGSPNSVGGSFECYNNKLTTLSGSPNSVGGSFDCYNNKLTTNRSNTKIGGIFYSTLNEPGLTETNYNEWNIKQKRKIVLNKLKKSFLTDFY